MPETETLSTPEKTPSTHRTDVYRIKLDPHPNADRLSVVRLDGFTCVVATDQWAGVELAAYVQPDSLVDVTRPEFAFLAKDAGDRGPYRVRAKKLRGIQSFGLLVPAPAGASEGDDVSEVLGVGHYEKPDSKQEMSVAVKGPDGKMKKVGVGGGDTSHGPPGIVVPKYDLEPGRKYGLRCLEKGEPVYITEKTHGQNGRYVFAGGKFFVGSRTEWKREWPNQHITAAFLVERGVEPGEAEATATRLTLVRSNTSWWNIDCLDAVRRFCEKYPGYVLYGEAYGSAVQGNFLYGKPAGTYGFAAFDVLVGDKFLDTAAAYELAAECGVPWVKFLTPDGPSDTPAASLYDFDTVCALAEGKSTYDGKTQREGVVVVPAMERLDDRCGRVKLKWVGQEFLEKDKG